VAEVLPVSSSAQLSLLPFLLRWPVSDQPTAFAAGLHGGSALGLAAALREDLADLDAGTGCLLVLSCLPAAAAGLLGQEAVERRLGGPGPTAALLAGAGTLMWLADRRPQTRGVGPREAAAAALAQVLALAPGVSRSGATLTALRALGVRREDAARFSVLMSLPVTAGAAAVTVVRARQLPPAGPTALAATASFVTAAVVDRASRRFLTAAALYRAALAAAVAVRLRHDRESR
jgi:undecaprenyl-diphosphatase